MNPPPILLHCCICKREFNCADPAHGYKFAAGVCSWACMKRKEFRDASRTLRQGMDPEREDAYVLAERARSPHLFT